MTHNYNPDIPLDLQRILHDEVDSFCEIAENWPEELQVLIIGIIVNDDGHSHWYYKSKEMDPIDKLNMAIALNEAMSTIMSAEEGTDT